VSEGGDDKQNIEMIMCGSECRRTAVNEGKNARGGECGGGIDGKPPTTTDQLYNETTTAVWRKRVN